MSFDLRKAMEPIYVVSGFPRSGTSMMMQCLEAGGMHCMYTPNAARASATDQTDRYELDTMGELRDWQSLAGKAIKIIRDNFRFVPRQFRLRIVYMTRSPAEIRRSYERSWGLRGEAVAFLDGYAQAVERDLLALRSAGHEVTAMRYADAVGNPESEIARLGWPLDAAKAASAVRPELYRAVA